MKRFKNIFSFNIKKFHIMEGQVKDPERIQAILDFWFGKDHDRNNRAP